MSNSKKTISIFGLNSDLIVFSKLLQVAAQHAYGSMLPVPVLDILQNVPADVHVTDMTAIIKYGLKRHWVAIVQIDINPLMTIQCSADCPELSQYEYDFDGLELSTEEIETVKRLYRLNKTRLLHDLYMDGIFYVLKHAQSLIQVYSQHPTNTPPQSGPDHTYLCTTEPRTRSSVNFKPHTFFTKED